MKLYMHPFSPNARRARIAIRLAGVKFEEELVDLQTGANRTPEYLAKNPNGKVPVLVDEDFTLWESAAICQYVANKAGKTNLWPTDPRGQADVSRWQAWQLAHWGPSISPIIYENMFKQFRSAGPADPVVIEKALKEYRMFAEVLDNALKGRDFLCGKELSLADVAVSPPLEFAPIVQLPLDEYANIRGWWARLSAMEAWQTTKPQFPGK